MSDEGLVEKLRSPGYCPDDREVGAVFRLLGGEDEKLARFAERALFRKGAPARDEAFRRFEGSRAPERSRLTALIGRFAARRTEEVSPGWLVARLSDADSKTRRRAAAALGKLSGPGVSDALLVAWNGAEGLPDLRALGKALGNVGGPAALAAFETREGRDVELDRILSEARLKIERAELRRRPSGIDASAAPPRPIPVLLHVRTGLEEVLVEELGRSDARVAGAGRVEVALSEPLETLWRARTFLHFGIPLPRGPEHEAVDAVVKALTRPFARAVFGAFTRGLVRYRIEWADGGRRRAATFRAAASVRRACPELVNDPTDASWEAVVTERAGRSAPEFFVELWPKGLSDPRFAYRRRALPASSHPTIAAALARIGGVRPDDVVWDPFVGAATELVERGMLGPYARLYGSDVDPAALAFAEENLRAARISNFQLREGDARTSRPPEQPTLVITNPPFGRRVLARAEIEPLLERTLDNLSRVLSPNGRIVWVSPLPDATARAAGRFGLRATVRVAVDLGGPFGEIQMLEPERSVRAKARQPARKL